MACHFREMKSGPEHATAWSKVPVCVVRETYTYTRCNGPNNNFIKTKVLLITALVSNYRPISILAIILEKHVKSLCQEHLCDQAPISPRHWGFMSSRSSVSALLQVIEDWSRALDQGQEVCVVMSKRHLILSPMLLF